MAKRRIATLRRAARSYRSSLAGYRQLTSLPLTQEGVVYHCPLAASTRRNLARQSINKSLLRWIEIADPHILHVGVTTHCNLSCPSCPVGVGALGRPAEHLDFETYRRTVDELRGSLLFMLFWDWGEPFLHPQLLDMIAHAKRSRIMTVSSTNLSMKLTKNTVDRIVTCGLDHLIVCIEGAEQEIHETYRRGSRLALLLSNLERIAAAKSRLDSIYPMIEVRTLASRHNESSLARVLAMASDFGAQLYSLKNLRPFDYRGHDWDHEMVPRNPRLARYKYAKGGEPHASRRLAESGEFNCGKPFYAPTLNSDGKLAFCSYATEPGELFGDVAGGFSRVWSKRSSRFKRLEFGRREGTRACLDCFFRIVHSPTVLHTVPLGDFPPDLSLLNPMTREEFLELLEERNPSSG